MAENIRTAVGRMPSTYIVTLCKHGFDKALKTAFIRRTFTTTMNAMHFHGKRLHELTHQDRSKVLQALDAKKYTADPSVVRVYVENVWNEGLRRGILPVKIGSEK